MRSQQSLHLRGEFNELHLLFLRIHDFSFSKHDGFWNEICFRFLRRSQNRCENGLSSEHLLTWLLLLSDCVKSKFWGEDDFSNSEWDYFFDDKLLNVSSYIHHFGKIMHDWHHFSKFRVFRAFIPWINWDSILWMKGVTLGHVVNDDDVLKRSS